MIKHIIDILSENVDYCKITQFFHSQDASGSAISKQHCIHLFSIKYITTVLPYLLSEKHTTIGQSQLLILSFSIYFTFSKYSNKENTILLDALADNHRNRKYLAQFNYYIPPTSAKTVALRFRRQNLLFFLQIIHINIFIKIQTLSGKIANLPISTAFFYKQAKLHTITETPILSRKTRILSRKLPTFA